MILSEARFLRDFHEWPFRLTKVDTMVANANGCAVVIDLGFSGKVRAQQLDEPALDGAKDAIGALYVEGISTEIVTYEHFGTDARDIAGFLSVGYLMEVHFLPFLIYYLFAYIFIFEVN